MTVSAPIQTLLPGIGGYKMMGGVLKSNDASPRPIRQNLRTIRERYGVARIGIFGSVARGEETPASDIDVLVEFREGEETFDHFMDLKFYLEDLLGRKTDLVIADTLKPRIRDAVLGEVVYAWRPPVVS